MTKEQELQEKIAWCEKALADGDTWLGVFENHDLSHSDIGRRCIFPFSLSDGSWDKAEIDKTRAPDGRFIGLGWRYLLILKTKSAQEAAMCLLRVSEEETKCE